MGLGLQKEECQEIVHHRSLLGVCWNRRPEEQQEDERLAEGNHSGHINNGGAGSGGPRVRVLHPSRWVAVNESMMALKTRKSCFSLAAYNDPNKERRNRRSSARDGDKAALQQAAGAGWKVKMGNYSFNSVLANDSFNNESFVSSRIDPAAVTTTTMEGSGSAPVGAGAGGRRRVSKADSTVVLKKLKDSKHYSHFAVALYSRHPFLERHHMGISKDVYFRVAPSHVRYDHAVLHRFPFFRDVSAPKGSTAVLAPQELSSGSLNAKLLMVTYTPHATDDPSAAERVFDNSSFQMGSSGGRRPVSYPMEDQDESPSHSSEFTQPPVVVFSISALELLMMPPEAEVTFGGWCTVSLEDERQRVIQVLRLLVDQLEKQASFKLPPELLKDNIMDTLLVPRATHLRDYEERKHDLHEKLYYRKKLKGLNYRSAVAAAQAGKAGAAAGGNTSSKGRSDGEEMWFPYSFLVAVVPMYECGVVPTTFHQVTSHVRPVSLHLLHQLSRKMFGVGCVTGIRYGGMLTFEQRGKVGVNDLPWMRHLLALGDVSYSPPPPPPAPTNHSMDDRYHHPVPSRRPSLVGGKRRSGVGSPQLLSPEDECLKSYERSYEPVFEVLQLLKQVLVRRLSDQRKVGCSSHVFVAYTRLQARLKVIQEEEKVRLLFPLFVSFPGGSGYHSMSSPDGSNHYSPRRRNRNGGEDGEDDGSSSDSSITREPFFFEMGADDASTTTTSVTDVDEVVVVDASPNSRSRSRRGGGAGGGTTITGEEDDEDEGDRRSSTSRLSAVNRKLSPSAVRKKNKKKLRNTLLRGDYRQIGGLKVIDANQLLHHGVTLDVVGTAVVNWVQVLLRSPIRARPLSLYLQRYEGICNAIRLCSTELVNPVFSSPMDGGGMVSSSFRLDHEASPHSFAGPGEAIATMTLNIGSFRAPAVGGAGMVGSFNGNGSFMNADDVSLQAPTKSNISGVTRGGNGGGGGSGMVRGVPFLTTYTGVLDPVVEAVLPSALRERLEMYHQFDPQTSTALLTEKEREGQIEEACEFLPPGVDEDWLRADIILRNLTVELDGLHDVLVQARGDLVERLMEYLRVSSYFLPNTHLDRVTPHVVFMKMLRQSSDYIPVREINQDWLSTIIALMTTPYEAMFASNSGSLSSNTLQQEPFVVTRRLLSYLPQEEAAANSLFTDLCDANREHLLKAMEQVNGWGAGDGSPSSLPEDDPTLMEYRIIPSVLEVRDVDGASRSSGRDVLTGALGPTSPRSSSGYRTLPPRPATDLTIAPMPLAVVTSDVRMLPRGHLFTGGSLGLLAGTFMFYAEYLRREAVRVPFPTLDAWIASGQVMLLRRLVIWGARGGTEGRQTKTFCGCGGDGLAWGTSSNAGSGDENVELEEAIGSTTMREQEVATLANRGTYEQEGASIQPSHVQSAEEAFGDKWKGCAFERAEGIALFNAIHYYLTTLRRLSQDFKGQQFESAPVRPVKRKSWLKRLWDSNNNMKSSGPDDGEQSPQRQPSSHAGVGEEEDQGTARKNSSSRRRSAYPTTFELCVASNYYYFDRKEQRQQQDGGGGAGAGASSSAFVHREKKNCNEGSEGITRKSNLPRNKRVEEEERERYELEKAYAGAEEVSKKEHEKLKRESRMLMHELQGALSEWEDQRRNEEEGGGGDWTKGSIVLMKL